MAIHQRLLIKLTLLTPIQEITFSNLYSSTSQQQSNSIYDDYPPYYDYFHGTYRKFSPKWKNLNRILDWIQVASET